MKKVNKLAIFKMVRQVGLTPVEESWKVSVDNYYNSYYGASSTTDYSLGTLEGIDIECTKESGSEPSFTIRHNKKNMKEKSVELQGLFKKYGYDTDVSKYVERNALDELIKRLKNEDLYNSDLVKINNFIDEVVKE